MDALTIQWGWIGGKSGTPVVVDYTPTAQTNAVTQAAGKVAETVGVVTQSGAKVA
jgi:hypothetical protein